jgi:subtilisin family serine protease
VRRTKAAYAAAFMLLVMAGGFTPARADESVPPASPGERTVTVSCVTDAADVVSVDVPASQAQDAIRTLPLENPCDMAAVDGTATLMASNDTYRLQQYALDNVPFENAWLAATGTGVTVAVIDTGVQSDHADLLGQVVPGRDYITDVEPWTATDVLGHGTHVAGIIAALSNNFLGIAGAAPGVKILPVRVFQNTASGVTASFSDIGAGIQWAVDHGADVVSLSLGGGMETFMKAGVDYALAKGVVVVAAAGNSGAATVTYPAAYPGVIAVAATDRSNAKASYSQYGSQVSVSAPGDAIYSTIPSGYDSMSGTSMATPYVSAEAALILQAHPGYSPEEVKALIESSATDLVASPAKQGRDDYTGAGLINPAQALCGGTCLPAPTLASLSVATGPTGGGTSVTLTGTNFAAVTGVQFGSSAAAIFAVNSTTGITATTPARLAGTVDVTVTTATGSARLPSSFTFATPPGGVPPADGADPPVSGGGGGAGAGGGGGGVVMPVEAPPAAAAGGGGGGGDPGSYIRQLVPATGQLAGGTRVRIQGYGFWNVTGVTFGGKQVLDYTYVDGNELEIVTPPGEVGWQPVAVWFGVQKATAAFNYQPASSFPVTSSPVMAPTGGMPTAASPSGQRVQAPAAPRVASRSHGAAIAWRVDASAAVGAYVTVYSRGVVVKRVSVPTTSTRTVIDRLRPGVGYRFTVTLLGADGRRATSPMTRLVRIPR